MQNSLSTHSRRGVALLMVLFVTMAVAIISLGFLSRCDVELACGQNMLLRAQMDQLADSGLEHAKGLILNPQDVASAYWPGAARQQILAASNDYYDVNVARVASDPMDYCTYLITCQAYRLDGERVTGRSRLAAELRLDPCIAVWTGLTTLLRPNHVIHGDLYCAGDVLNLGTVDGDVFCGALSGAITGRHKAPSDLSLAWPPVTAAYFNPDYSTGTIGPGTVASSTYGPARVWRCAGDLTLAGNVTIEGMLLVQGNLTIRGSANTISAAKNLPAVYVGGNLTVGQSNALTIDGLAVVAGAASLSAAASNVQVTGGLFVGTTILETALDSAGSNHDLVVHGAPMWRPAGGQNGGSLEFDGVDDRLEDTTAAAYLNGLAAVTISLWVKSDVVYEDRGILYVRDPDGSDMYFGLRYDRTGAYGSAHRCIKASIGTTAGYTQVESSGDVQTTSWQHLAVRWASGGKLELYINGALNPLTYDRGAVAGSVSGVQKLTIGRGAYGCYWDGLIDDVRIYNRALAPGEIWPPRDAISGLIAHWRLDEGGSQLTVVAEPARSAILIGSLTGSPEYWGQAGGAFFRRMERN